MDLSYRRGIQFWDVRDREYVRVPGRFPISFSMNIDLPIRFTAKVALGSGYYIHGESFRHHVDHRQLRDVMNIDPSTLDKTKSLVELGLGHLTLRTHSWIEKVGDEEQLLRFPIMLCNSVKNSVVIMMYGHDSFFVFVGLLGQYLGMVNVPASSEALLGEVPDRLGSVFELSNNGLYKYPLIDQLIDHTDIVAFYGLEP